MTEKPILKKKKPAVAVPAPEISSESRGTVEGVPQPQSSQNSQDSQDSQAKSIEKSSSSGFGFGIGKMKELTEAFKKAQQVQEAAKRLQQDMENTELTSRSETRVVAVFNGIHAPLRVTIAEELMSEPVETIEAEVLSACQDAFSQSMQLMKGKMEELTSGLAIPDGVLNDSASRD